MNKENKQELLKTLFDVIDERLRAYSFIEDAAEVKLLEVKMKRWIRKTKWKCDVVRAVYPKKYLDSIDIMVEVELPLHVDDKITFDGTTVSYLARKHGGSYRFPSFAFSSKGFIQKLVDDMEKALVWFEYYNTPNDCLGRLKAGETNMGPFKNEGATKKASDYLVSLTK